MSESLDHDTAVRLAAFEFLGTQEAIYGDSIPHSVLRGGFLFEGERVPLVGPQGIFKPKVLAMPLTIMTVAPKEERDRPYDDSFDADLLLYRYRGTDPMHRDNVGLRRAMELQRPLIYLLGIGASRYVADWPAYVVEDSPESLTFTVEFSGSRELLLSPGAVVADPQRSYVTRLTRQRLHQRAFREKVLRAYRQTCAVCRLRHAKLLDAAHIIRDSDPLGFPREANGLALCKLHHAAFDQNILGVRPDYVVEIRRDVLDEVDGPMLIHGLQGFQGSRLILPRRPADRPDKGLLEVRYEEFRSAS